MALVYFYKRESPDLKKTSKIKIKKTVEELTEILKKEINELREDDLDIYGYRSKFITKNYAKLELNTFDQSPDYCRIVIQIKPVDDRNVEFPKIGFYVVENINARQLALLLASSHENLVGGTIVKRKFLNPNRFGVRRVIAMQRRKNVRLRKRPFCHLESMQRPLAGFGIVEVEKSVLSEVNVVA